MKDFLYGIYYKRLKKENRLTPIGILKRIIPVNQTEKKIEHYASTKGTCSD